MESVRLRGRPQVADNRRIITTLTKVRIRLTGGLSHLLRMNTYPSILFEVQASEVYVAFDY